MVAETQGETDVQDQVERGTQTESRAEHDEVEDGPQGRLVTHLNTV